MLQNYNADLLQTALATALKLDFHFGGF